MSNGDDNIRSVYFGFCAEEDQREGDVIFYEKFRREKLEGPTDVVASPDQEIEIVEFEFEPVRESVTLKIFDGDEEIDSIGMNNRRTVTRTKNLWSGLQELRMSWHASVFEQSGMGKIRYKLS